MRCPIGAARQQNEKSERTQIFPRRLPRTIADKYEYAPVTRRGFLKLAGTCVAAAVPDGTPEQIHLTWGDDPCSEVTVSWAPLAPAANPRVRVSSGYGRPFTVHAVRAPIPMA